MEIPLQNPRKVHFPVQEHLAGLRDGYFIGGSTGHKTVEYMMQIYANYALASTRVTHRGA